MKIEGKVVVATGAASGTGRALCECFPKAGVSKDRTDKVWGEPEITAMLAVAFNEMKLALWSGQRQGDLLLALVGLRPQTGSISAVQDR